MDVEIIGNNPNPSLADLNKKAVQKLYELMDGLDAKSDPDLVRAIVESLSKLNSSLRNSGILPQEESETEKRERETQETIVEVLRG